METGKALQGKRLYSGVVREAAAHPNRKFVRDFFWTKAHVDASKLEYGSQAWKEAKGNELADEHANEARALHPEVPHDVSDDFERIARHSRLIFQTMAAVLPIFPRPPKGLERRRSNLRKLVVTQVPEHVRIKERTNSGHELK